MEYLNTFNGNGRGVQKPLPKLVWLGGEINDVALEHIKANTGLDFQRTHFSYEAQPITANQIATLLVTYNFKTRYYDNWNYKNELHLKLDHHVGFNIDSVCYACVRHNRIGTHGLKSDERLAC